MRYLCIWAYHEKLLTKHTLETTKMATKCFHGITRNKYKKSLWMLSLMWNKLMYTLGISGILMSVSSGLSWHAYIIHLCYFCIINPIGHRRFFQYRIGVGILLEHQNKCIWTTTFLAEVIRCPKVAARRNKHLNKSNLSQLWWPCSSMLLGCFWKFNFRKIASGPPCKFRHVWHGY